MPLQGVNRYRVKTTPKGEKIRLAFTKSGRVLEAKNLRTGATHINRPPKPGDHIKDALTRKRRRYG